MKKNRERSIGKLVYFTEKEIATIESRMAESGMTNFSPTIYLWVVPRHPAVLLSNLLPKL